MHAASLTRVVVPILITFFLGSCTMSSDGDAPEQGSFITSLGQDTLAVERFSMTSQRIEAEVMLRTPSTTLRHYIMELDEAGIMRRLEATVRDPASPEAPPLRKDLLLADSTGFSTVITEDGEERTFFVEAGPDALPFLDMIHWPFEIVLKRAYQSGNTLFEQPLLGGRRPLLFEIQRLSDDSMTVKHPFRGTMGVTVDNEGRLVHLDASATTRKLSVVRQDDVDVTAMAQHFAQRDAAGNAFGPLSGRGETLANVHGASIRVDYGQPIKRGRDIFGHLVPWDEVWRTGANRATHFETDRDLQFGDVSMPTGTYTLFTIPQPSGGLLLISKQTGQGGTTYNEDQDLGRVAITLEALEEPVEVFTIAVFEENQQGKLQLKWDQTALSVPFSVKK